MKTLTSDFANQIHLEWTKDKRLGSAMTVYAMIAFKNGIEYVNHHYDVKLEYEHMKCEFSNLNEQCIKERCPYYA